MTSLNSGLPSRETWTHGPGLGGAARLADRGPCWRLAAAHTPMTEFGRHRVGRHRAVDGQLRSGTWMAIECTLKSLVALTPGAVRHRDRCADSGTVVGRRDRRPRRGRRRSPPGAGRRTPSCRRRSVHSLRRERLVVRCRCRPDVARRAGQITRPGPCALACSTARHRVELPAVPVRASKSS